MGFHRGPKIVTDGLVLHLDAANPKSYPGSGTTWSDLSGNGLNGTLTNGPTYNSDNNGSLVFDGGNDYVEGTVVNNGGGTGTSQSYNAWFKVNSLNTGQSLQGIFLWERLNGIIIVNSSGEVAIQTDGDNSLGDLPITPIIQTSTWYNIAFNFNQGSSYECWLNGKSYGSTPTTDTSPPPAQNYAVGIRRRGVSTFDSHLNGEVATVKVYNRALTQQEIQQNYNATKSRFGL